VGAVKKDPRTARVNIRLTPDEKARLEGVAQKKKRDASDWSRLILLDAAEKEAEPLERKKSRESNLGAWLLALGEENATLLLRLGETLRTAGLQPPPPAFRTDQGTGTVPGSARRGTGLRKKGGAGKG